MGGSVWSAVAVVLLVRRRPLRAALPLFVSRKRDIGGGHATASILGALGGGFDFVTNVPSRVQIGFGVGTGTIATTRNFDVLFALKIFTT